MPKTNSERLQDVAEGLQPLNERIVYVGGAMVGLYATDPAAAEPRTTIDVDCVVNTMSYAEHAQFENTLRSLHFHNDKTPNAPLCRWLYKGEPVDVMSVEEKSLTFGNVWYGPGFHKRESYKLPSGLSIYRLPVVYYIATKIAALLSRGGQDWRGAKDFEDIVYVLNYCSEFSDKFEYSDCKVKKYVSEQFEAMLKRPNIVEEIESVISFEEIERTDLILKIMRTIASFKSNKPRLKLQFVSDLHLEFQQNSLFLKEHPLDVAGDILLIAGDTAYLDLPESKSDSYSQYDFWDWASRHYKQVVVCLGNHDFYGNYDLATIPDGYCKQIRHNVNAFYNAVVHFEDVDVIVSTLWSHIEPSDAFFVERNVSDFYRIKYKGHRLTVSDFNCEHERCLQFVKKAVAESGAKIKIVLTHHVPTQRCTASEFKGNTINGAFTVELGDYIADSGIDYWIYGHSHRNIEAQIGKTLILSNQLGYISHGEQLKQGFNNQRMIEI